MVRIFSLTVLCTALTGVLNAAEQYRICFRNTAGQVSLPDSLGPKNYFIDLAKAGREPAQFFGGTTRKRFKVVSYDDVNKVLTCQDLDTGKIFELPLGKMVNLLELSE